MTEHKESDLERRKRQSWRLIEIMAEEGLQLVPHIGWGYIEISGGGVREVVVLYDDRDRSAHEQVRKEIPWSRVVKLIDKGPWPS